MRRRMTAFGAVAAALVLAGSTLAAGNITVKVIGAFGVGDVVGYGTGHTFTMQAAPGSTVLTVVVRVPPGGRFPWHYHTAGLTVTMTQGSLTVQDASTCATQTFSAGGGFAEEAEVIHQAYNAGSTLAVLYVTYVGIPAGVPPDVFEPASYDPC
jgi:quercetin dioxygenase-like cupin family protein